jgi:hypothetical protein
MSRKTGESAQIMIVFDWLRVSCVQDFTFRHSQAALCSAWMMNDKGRYRQPHARSPKILRVPDFSAA